VALKIANNSPTTPVGTGLPQDVQIRDVPRDVLNEVKVGPGPYGRLRTVQMSLKGRPKIWWLWFHFSDFFPGDVLYPLGRSTNKSNRTYLCILVHIISAYTFIFV